MAETRTAKVAYWDNWTFIDQHPERFRDRPRPIAFEMTARIDGSDELVTVQLTPEQARLVYQSLGEYVSNGWRVFAKPQENA